MVLEDKQLDQTETQVLAELDRSGKPYHPRELIDHLRAQDVSEALARAAIWYLIDRHEVELTPDRLLRRLSTPRRDELAVGVASR